MATTRSTSTAAATTADFAGTCEGFSVDSRLLYNDIEHLSNKRFRRNRQLVTWTRLLACAAVVSAGIGGVAAYYQRAKIYRVWRLRNPHRVRQLSMATMISGGFSFCALLFLISPIGFMRMHDMETTRTHQLDAVAVAALVQEQNFRTLAAWGTTTNKEEGKGVSALHRPSSSSSSVVSQEDAAAAAAAQQQWVWKEVVLDSALLPRAYTPTAATSPDAGAAESADHVSSGNAREERAVHGGEDVAALKKEMAAQLLLPSPTKKTPITKSSSAGAPAEEKNEEETCSTRDSLHAPRRVIAYTNDAAALQSALVATVEAWEALVKAKADIVAKVI